MMMCMADEMVVTHAAMVALMLMVIIPFPTKKLTQKASRSDSAS